MRRGRGVIPGPLCCGRFTFWHNPAVHTKRKGREVSLLSAFRQVIRNIAANKRWAKLSNEAVLRGSYQRSAQVHALIKGGCLVGRGEVHPLLSTIPEQAGSGTAMLKPNGMFVFTLDSSGYEHKIWRKYIKGVEEVRGDGYVPSGHLMLTFDPAIPFSLSLEPFPHQRADWLALSPKERPAS